MKPILFIFSLLFAANIAQAQLIYLLNGQGIYRYNLLTGKITLVSNKDNGSFSMAMHCDGKNKYILLNKTRSTINIPDTLNTIDINTGNVISKDTFSSIALSRVEYDGHDTLYGITPAPFKLGYYDRVNKKSGIIASIPAWGYSASTFDTVNKRYFLKMAMQSGKGSTDTIATIDTRSGTVSYDTITAGLFNCIEYSQKDNKIYGVSASPNPGFYSFDLITKKTTLVTTSFNMFWSGDRCTTFDQLNNRYFIQKDRTTISNPDTLFIYNIDSNILIKKLLATIPGTYTPVYSGEAFDEPVAISSIATGTVRIYPNPVAGTLYIDAKEKGRLHIYAPNGQLQLESTIEKGNNTISLNTLPAANYMVVVEMPAEIYATQIVKQ